MNQTLAAPRSTRRHWWLSVVRWFDSSVAENNLRPEEVYKIDWLRAIPFLMLHLACLGVIWVGWSPLAVGLAVALYFLRIFTITAFYHRYFAHRTFKTSRPVQFIFALLGSCALQKGPLWWAAQHRKHHRHADKPEDIHSPNEHSLLWAHMLWITARGSFNTDMNEVKDLAKFPELRLLNRYDTAVPLLLAVFLFGLGALLKHVAPGLGTSGPQLLIWGFFISTVAVFHGTSLINSAAHRVGWRRYDTHDQSRNSMILALLTLGEGWHNNHHYYPATARQGFFWWEIDITYYLLLLMARTGLIWELRPVPEHVRAGRPQKVAEEAVK